MTRILHPSILSARVAAQNRANSIMNEIAPKFADVMRPFVGQKFFLSNGDRSKRVKDAVTAFLDSARYDNVRIWATSGAFGGMYSLHVSASERCPQYNCAEQVSGDTCTSMEATYYAIDVDSQNICKKVNDWKPAKMDYTVGQVEFARAIIKKLESELSEAKRENAFCIFGGFDR